MQTIFAFSIVLLLLYLAASPRFAQWYYRRRIFIDETARLSDPEVVQSFGWIHKVQLLVPSVDGSAMNAWFFGRKDNEKGTLAIYFVGRGSSISNCIDEVERLLKAGYAVFIGEYRGFGESKGPLPSIDSVCRDGLAFYDYAFEKLGYNPEEIVIVGESLGGGIASYVCKHRQPAGLVLRNTFTSLPEIGREHVPFTRIFPLLLHPSNHLGTRAILRSWQRPLLIIHAELDETVPFHHGTDNFAIAATHALRRRFIALPQSTHCEVHESAAGLIHDGLTCMREIVEKRKTQF